MTRLNTVTPEELQEFKEDLCNNLNIQINQALDKHYNLIKEDFKTMEERFAGRMDERFNSLGEVLNQHIKDTMLEYHKVVAEHYNSILADHEARIKALEAA